MPSMQSIYILREFDRFSVIGIEDRKQAKCQELGINVKKTVTTHKMEFWVINNSLHDHVLMFDSW